MTTYSQPSHSSKGFQSKTTNCDIIIPCLRACLHGGRGLQVGEVTRLSIQSLILIWSSLHDRWDDHMRYCMDRRVTPPTWGPPPPRKQALKFKTRTLFSRFSAAHNPFRPNKGVPRCLVRAACKCDSVRQALEGYWSNSKTANSIFNNSLIAKGIKLDSHFLQSEISSSPLPDPWHFGPTYFTFNFNSLLFEL